MQPVDTAVATSRSGDVVIVYRATVSVVLKQQKKMFSDFMGYTVRSKQKLPQFSFSSIDQSITKESLRRVN